MRKPYDSGNSVKLNKVIKLTIFTRACFPVIDCAGGTLKGMPYFHVAEKGGGFIHFLILVQ